MLLFRQRPLATPFPPSTKFLYVQLAKGYFSRRRKRVHVIRGFIVRKEAVIIPFAAWALVKDRLVICTRDGYCTLAPDASKTLVDY